MKVLFLSLHCLIQSLDYVFVSSLLASGLNATLALLFQNHDFDSV